MPKEAGKPPRKAVGSRPGRMYATFSPAPQGHGHIGQMPCRKAGGSDGASS